MLDLTVSIGLQETCVIRNQSVSVVFPILDMAYYSYLGLDYYESIVEEVSRENLLESEKVLPNAMGMKLL